MTTQYEYGPWTLHDGGECPVGPDVMVQAVLADSVFADRDHAETRKARAWIWPWAPDGKGSDIAFYRIATEKKPREFWHAEIATSQGAAAYVLSSGYATKKDAEEAGIWRVSSGGRFIRAVRFVEALE